MLHSFAGRPTDGNDPVYSVLTLVGSSLVGTTYDGGTANAGTVFSLNTDGTGFQVLYAFPGYPADGANADYATLVLIGSTLYGTTDYGGADNEGTVYSINVNGTGYQVLHSFTGTASDGDEPVPGLTVVGSTLVGVAEAGGTANDGVVFSLNTNGTGFQLLHSFSGADGSVPNHLTLVGSTLFGTTYRDGTGHFGGTLFSMSTSGTGFQVLHTFSGGGLGDGTGPTAGGLTLVGSTLFGTTRQGGSAGDGTLFSITTAGTGYQVVRSFLGGSADGQNPSNGGFDVRRLDPVWNDRPGRKFE